MLIQAAVLQLSASLLFLSILFYLHPEDTDSHAAPTGITTGTFLPHGTNSWVNGTQHRSQTITGSDSNTNQSQLCQVTSCDSSFHQKNRADNEKLFQTVVWSATCKSTSCLTQPELVLRIKTPAWIAAASKVSSLSEKMPWATAMRFGSLMSKDIHVTAAAPVTTSYGSTAAHLLTSPMTRYWSDDSGSLSDLEFKCYEDTASALFLDGSVAFIERCKHCQ